MQGAAWPGMAENKLENSNAGNYIATSNITSLEGRESYGIHRFKNGRSVQAKELHGMAGKKSQ